MSRFSDKEKQHFWNLKFHAVLLTIFSQITLTLNCYSAMVSSWRHVISPVPEWKTHPNLAMTQHISEHPRNRQSPNDLPVKTASRRDKFIDLLHWSIYSSLHDTSLHQKSSEKILSYNNNDNIPRTLQYWKTPQCPDHPQVQNKFGIEDDNDTEKFPQSWARR